MSDDNWGSAARFGIFIVGAEAVPEAEWWAMAPPGVSIHAARVTAAAPWATPAADGGLALAPDVARGAAQFAAMDLDAAVLAHSSSSFAGGPSWDDAAAAALGRALGPGTRATTNGRDCALALRASGVARPFVVFPPWFGEGLIGKGLEWLAAERFAPAAHLRQRPPERWVNTAPQDLYGQRMHLAQDPDDLLAQIVVACPETADGVLIAGTGLRAVAIIERLEAALARPVVTANQASLWRCLGLAGIQTPVAGYGALLAAPRATR